MPYTVFPIITHIQFYVKQEANVKEEVKRAVDVVTRKVEREVKSLKDETAIFKGKAEELEQRLNRVL